MFCEIQFLHRQVPTPDEIKKCLKSGNLGTKLGPDEALSNRLGPGVIPVLVTNYEIPEVLKSEMESDGVKILSLPDSRDALADLGKQFAELVGFRLPAK
jgi:hypothetical protein